MRPRPQKESESINEPISAVDISAIVKLDQRINSFVPQSELFGCREREVFVVALGRGTNTIKIWRCQGLRVSFGAVSVDN